LIFTNILVSQEIEGLPKIINYYNPNQPYTAEQVWDIEQTPDGLLYFASGQFFLEFDGVNFTNLFSSINPYYLSIDVDTAKRKFYIGQKNSLSFSNFVNNKYELEDIELPVTINYCWKTFFIDSSVYYFFNNTDVIYFSKLNIELVQRPSNFNIERGFQVAGRIYAVSENGIAEIKDGILELLNFTDDFCFKEDIRVMLEFDDNNVLIGTKANHLFLMNKNDYSITPFEHEAENLILGAKIYNGTKLNDTTYIITSLLKGVFIITQLGKLIGHFDQNNGLISNAVYVAHVDKYKNIWLGTGKGVSQIYWDYPVKYIDNRSGLNAGIMAFNVFTNKLLVSTYSGLLYSQINEDNWHPSLHLTDSSILYSANIITPNNFSDKYLIVTGYEKFQVLNNDLKVVYEDKINSQPVEIFESNIKPNRFFWGSKRGFSVYNLQENLNDVRLVKEKDFFNLSFNIDYIFFDKNNDLWLTHSNSLFYIDFDENENLDDYGEYFYDIKQGLPNSTITSVFEINDALFFSTYSGVYRIKDLNVDPSEYLFVKANNTLFNASFDDQIINFLETDKHYFFQGLNYLYKCSKNLENISKIALKSLFEPFSCKLYLKNELLWVNSKDRVFVVDTADLESKQGFYYDIGLKGLQVNTQYYSAYFSDSVFTLEKNTYTFLKDIENSNTNVTLEFYAPYFYYSENIRYKFFIVGESSEWEDMQGNILLLRQLNSGKYEIKIKAINYNNQESDEIVVKFTIKRYFYQTTLAYIFYTLVSIFFLVMGVLFITKQVRIRNKSLEEVVQKRTALLEEQKEELSVQSRELIEQKKLLEREKERQQIAMVELKQLSLVAQKTDNSVLIVEKNGKFEWWNRGFTDLFAYKIEKYNNLPLRQAHKKIRPDIFKEIKSYSSDKGVISYTSHEVFDNGEEIWYQTTINPVALTEIEYTKFVVIDYNITSVKSNENEIQKLQESNQLTKNRLNKAIAEIKLNKEEYTKVKFFDTKNLEYAKLLKKVTIIENNLQYLNLNYFVIDLPQTELSGDFLWSRQFKKDEIIIIIGDATGHRIRGSINSVMTVSFLHDIYSLKQDVSNEDVLRMLDKKMSKVFNTLDTIKERDHLNLALVKINIKNKTIDFTSSRISLLLIRKEHKDIFYKYDYDGDRIDIGIMNDKTNRKKFTTHNIIIKESDRIYLSTDGWANQFGKFGIKKYSNKKIRNFLLSIQDKEIYSHQEEILQEFSQWKGSFEQTDDILIFGAELKFPKDESI